MMQKKTLIGVASFFLVFTLLIGYYAIAAEAGGMENPLVTIGYLEKINEEIDGKIKDGIDTYMADSMDGIDQKLAEAYHRISQMGGEGEGPNLADDPAFIQAVANALAEKVGTPAGSAPAIYQKVTIPAGKTMMMTMGSSFFLRVGSAVCVSTGTPGLVDTTVPGEIANGAAIEKNHDYRVTVEGGRGVKNNGTSEVVVFIMGVYTID